ncbi:MAG: transposase, partial [Candidatus Promineifilaceae bacterium]
SSGLLPDSGRAWRLEWLTNFLLDNFQYQAQLDKRIKKLLAQRGDYALIATVPYSGPNSLGTILAVTNNADRFSNYRKYVAYTGYFAGLRKSQTIDRTKMSNRGNRNLKRAYFQIAAPLVWFDKGENPYKELYQRKMAEGKEWYKAMPFVCAALARHSPTFGRQSLPQVQRPLRRRKDVPGNGASTCLGRGVVGLGDLPRREIRGNGGSSLSDRRVNLLLRTRWSRL